MNPFESFTDEEITARLSVPMIVDAFWFNEYGCEVSSVAREVGCSLMYLVRKYGTLIPHSLLLQAIAEHTDLSESTVGPFLTEAEKVGMVTVAIPESDKRQRLYGFTSPQKKKILRASNAYAYAAALAIKQAQEPTNTEFGRTTDNASYYRHIFSRINSRNDAILEKLTKLKQRLAWIIIAVLGLTLFLQPWATAMATWSTGHT